MRNGNYCPNWAISARGKFLEVSSEDPPGTHAIFTGGRGERETGKEEIVYRTWEILFLSESHLKIYAKYPPRSLPILRILPPYV